MRLVRLLVSCLFIIASSQLVFSQTGGKVTFNDESSGEQREDGGNFGDSSPGQVAFNRTREGKNLLDWIGLGTGQHVDPYVARINERCLTGDLAECFKSRALDYFSDFFDQTEYRLTDYVKVVRLPRQIVKRVDHEPYEYSSTPRSDESEWDQLVKFVSRKAEKFVKTVAFELVVPTSETGENRAYEPRFLDEIADEIDTIENKKDTLFSRHQLRKLLIPMLIVLKLFKLKLLLFLPLILGLASFKKFLGFMALVIPGLIGFFKLYKPLAQNYQPPVYTQSGVGYPHPHYKDNLGNHPFAEQQGYHDSEYHGNYQSEPVSFGQDLAYQGYRDYQHS